MLIVAFNPPPVQFIVPLLVNVPPIEPLAVRFIIPNSAPPGTLMPVLMLTTSLTVGTEHGIPIGAVEPIAVARRACPSNRIGRSSR